MLLAWQSITPSQACPRLLQRDIVEVDVAAGTTGRVLATTPEEHGSGGWAGGLGGVAAQQVLTLGWWCCAEQQMHVENLPAVYPPHRPVIWLRVPAARQLRPEQCWLSARLASSVTTIHAAAARRIPCPAEPARRFNDGKVSPQGTLLVGRMHAKWRDGERGRLYRLDPGSRCAGVVY